MQVDASKCVVSATAELFARGTSFEGWPEGAFLAEPATGGAGRQDARAAPSAGRAASLHVASDAVDFDL